MQKNRMNRKSRNIKFQFKNFINNYNKNKKRSMEMLSNIM